MVDVVKIVMLEAAWKNLSDLWEQHPEYWEQFKERYLELGKAWLDEYSRSVLVAAQR